MASEAIDDIILDADIKSEVDLDELLQAANQLVQGTNQLNNNDSGDDNDDDEDDEDDNDNNNNNHTNTTNTNRHNTNHDKSSPSGTANQTSEEDNMEEDDSDDDDDSKSNYSNSNSTRGDQTKSSSSGKRKMKGEIKRSHHNVLERKRRDLIKDSFSKLRDAVPTLTSERASRAQILKRAADFIQSTHQRNESTKSEIEQLVRKNLELENKIRIKEENKPST